MKNKIFIDELIKKLYSRKTYAYDDAYWLQMKQKLDAADKQKGGFYWQPLLLLLLLITAAGVIFYSYSTEKRNAEIVSQNWYKANAVQHVILALKADEIFVNMATGKNAEIANRREKESVTTENETKTITQTVIEVTPDHDNWRLSGRSTRQERILNNNIKNDAANTSVDADFYYKERKENSSFTQTREQQEVQFLLPLNWKGGEYQLPENNSIKNINKRLQRSMEYFIYGQVNLTTSENIQFSGFNVGIDAEKYIFNRWSISAGVAYQQVQNISLTEHSKQVQYDFDIRQTIYYRDLLSLHYLQLPLSLNYSTGALEWKAGAAPSYLFNTRSHIYSEENRNGTLTMIESKREFGHRYDLNLLQLNLFLGTEYLLADKLKGGIYFYYRPTRLSSEAELKVGLFGLSTQLKYQFR